MRRESWRSRVKHRLYMSQKHFKVASILLGWFLLFLALLVAYQQIDELIQNQN